MGAVLHLVFRMKEVQQAHSAQIPCGVRLDFEGFVDDMTLQAIGNTFTEWTIPSADEGFQKLDFPWSKEKAAKDRTSKMQTRAPLGAPSRYR